MTLKDRITPIIYKLILDVVRLSNTKSGNKHLLLIKTDEIGDYILFRNYLYYFKKATRYKDYKITIVGNKAWRQLYEAYDNGVADDVVWLDKKQFKQSLKYRYNFLKGIKNLRTSDVVNLIYSRSIYFDDAIAFAATGNCKTAMQGDRTNYMTEKKKNYDTRIYNTIINAGDYTVFDTVRSRNYVSTILDMPTLPVTTQLKPVNTQLTIDNRYYVLFLGAGNPERKWPLSCFLQTAEYIYDNYDITPIVCGGPDDNEDAENFIKQFSKNAVNLAGKTSLVELAEVLRKAVFLLCVDTGALHIAAAVGCPVVGLYSGKFYGRFGPYPKEITENFYAVYPDFADRMIAENDEQLYDTAVMKNDTIKMIPVAKILPFIIEIIKKTV